MSRLAAMRRTDYGEQHAMDRKWSLRAPRATRRLAAAGRITVLRPYTENAPSRFRLRLKQLMFPGTNWVSRDKSRLVKLLLSGTPENPVRTLDCGCGNAYFSQ